MGEAAFLPQNLTASVTLHLLNDSEVTGHFLAQFLFVSEKKPEAFICRGRSRPRAKLAEWSGQPCLPTFGLGASASRQRLEISRNYGSAVPEITTLQTPLRWCWEAQSLGQNGVGG